MKAFFLHICLLYCCLYSFAQSPYEIKKQVDIPLAVGIGIGLPLSYLLEHQKPRLTEQDIQQLNPQNVLNFDRFATRNWSLKAQHHSDILMYGAIGLPILFLLDQSARQDFGTMALIGSQTYLFNAALTNLTKQTFRRKRPFLYNPEVPMAYKLKNKDVTSSFFSGHTSIASTSTFMMAKMYHDLHPNSKARPYIWGTAAVIPAVMGYLRVKGGKHYASDVVVGYLVGMAVGILVPHFHLRQ